MAKRLTPAMRARLIAAYSHAGDLLHDAFTHKAIIQSLVANHNATFGYYTCTQRLRCAGIEVTNTGGDPKLMLDAWMGKAADALCNGQAPVRTSEPIPVIGGRDNAPGRLLYTTEARP